jgi:hypothetical protein
MTKINSIKRSKSGKKVSKISLLCKKLSLIKYSSSKKHGRKSVEEQSAAPDISEAEAQGGNHFEEEAMNDEINEEQDVHVSAQVSLFLLHNDMYFLVHFLRGFILFSFL